MDHQAIEKIQSLVHAAQIGFPGTDVPTMLVPEGYKLQSLEQYQTTPSRFRGTFATSSIEDYGNYVNEEDEARVFVDIDAMRAKAFFNLGNPTAPGHGDHTASLSLEKTSAFEACLSANGSSFAQKELAHWIEDWQHCITGIDSNGQELDSKKLANAVRKIEIKATSERSHEDGDWNTKRTGMDAHRNHQMLVNALTRCNELDANLQRIIAAAIADGPGPSTRAAIDEMPAHSLAQRDADKQADALERVLMYCRGVLIQTLGQELSGEDVLRIVEQQLHQHRPQAKGAGQ